MKELTKLFRHAMKVTQDPAVWSRLWGQVGVIVHASIMKTFEAGGRPKKWPMRISGRGRNFYRVEPSTLQDEGQLKGSIAFRVTSEAPVGGVKIGLLGGSGDTAAALRHGPVHQIGTRTGWRIRVKNAPYLQYPLRSISGPRTRPGKMWSKRKSVRVRKRPFLMIQKQEDIPEIARAVTAGIGDKLWVR